INSSVRVTEHIEKFSIQFFSVSLRKITRSEEQVIQYTILHYTILYVLVSFRAVVSPNEVIFLTFTSLSVNVISNSNFKSGVATGLIRAINFTFDALVKNS